MYFILFNEHLKMIFAGIAIFIIGINFIGNGFNLFSEKALKMFIQKYTSNNIKAFIFGFISTTLVQSSSLISVLVVSLLSVEVLSLLQAIGIMFGSNLGSTTTAWLVSSLGLKLNIASYSMPMIILGLASTFLKNKTYTAYGNVLLGLGFVLLAIHYMKTGFIDLQSNIDLASYSIDGSLGLILFFFIGAVMTVVMQSSGASIALIVTALALSQITYENAIALTIGVNIGTPFTAVLAAITSNIDGKRLAFVHLMFNVITAFFVFIFLDQFIYMIEYISTYFLLSPENYVIRLSIFHSAFNLFGILILFVFIPQIEKISKLILRKKYRSTYKAKYISKSLIGMPLASITALEKELVHLLKNADKVILRTISLQQKDVFASKNLKKTIKYSKKKLILDKINNQDIQTLHTKIMEFTLLIQNTISASGTTRVFRLKIAANEILQSVKTVQKIQKNINQYFKSNNIYVKKEYNRLRLELAYCIKTIFLFNTTIYNKKHGVIINKLYNHISKKDKSISKKINYLITQKKITESMASSLIKDSANVLNICKKQLTIANILFTNATDDKNKK
jgi:phosphate:Na+ symporter